MGKVLSVNISEKKGTVKIPGNKGTLEVGYGFVNDAHSGKWHRQVSLLDIESIKVMQDKGFEVKIGDFAENITTEGIDITQWKIGDIVKIGNAVIEVTQIGKECHDMCEVRKKVGDCIMPKKGIFARVLKGSDIAVDDKIEVLSPINIGVLTLSYKGAKGEREDKSGEVIKEMVKLIGGNIVKYEILPDEPDEVKNKLTEWSKPCEKVDLILTTGGTGFSRRDITPEATSAVIQRPVPGLSEAMRMEGYKNNPRAVLSRGVSGIRNNTLIVNLPGSVKGVKESLEAILEVVTHGIEILKGEAAECGG